MFALLGCQTITLFQTTSHVETKHFIGCNSCLKVHRTMCAELRKLVDRILRIIPQIEAARPSGMQALCLLNEAIDKAKQLLLYCSESSKLYLVCSSFYYFG